MNIIEAIQNKTNKQKDIALLYADLIHSPDRPDWGKINSAIVERWSRSGLIRVKKMAWKIVEG